MDSRAGRPSHEKERCSCYWNKTAITFPKLFCVFDVFKTRCQDGFGCRFFVQLASVADEHDRIVDHVRLFLRRQLNRFHVVRLRDQGLDVFQTTMGAHHPRDFDRNQFRFRKFRRTR